MLDEKLINDELGEMSEEEKEFLETPTEDYTDPLVIADARIADLEMTVSILRGVANELPYEDLWMELVSAEMYIAELEDELYNNGIKRLRRPTYEDKRNKKRNKDKNKPAWTISRGNNGR